MADIYGTNGNDILNGTSEEDNIYGFDGNDIIDGGTGNDAVIGDWGNDVLLGGAGADFINGGDGDDVIYADEQDTHVRGDAGHDVVYVQGSVGVNWILESFYYTGIEELHGTSGNDSVNNYGIADMAIYGDGGDDTLMGSLGNQILDGGAGNDLLSGGSGDDVLRGGNGDDQLTGDWGSDVLTGGAGLDLMNGGNGDDVLNADANDLYVRGDAGYDKVYIEGSTGVNWYIDGFYKSGFEEVHGSGGADTIVSWEPTAVSLFGRGGDDFLAGNSGNDTLAGGTENDTLYGGDGDDRYLFNLGDGIDTIQDTSSGAGNRIVFGAGIGQQDLTLIHDQLSQILTIQVGATGDAIRLVNFDPTGVSGSMVVSTLFFDDGSQVSLADLLGLGSGSGATITGTNGDDFLQGTAGGDVIEGLAGNDMLDGLGGDDIITGGAGADQLFGGNGNDVLNVDAADFLVMGGDGYDVAYVNDTQSVYWYMDDFGSMSGLEEVHGGTGNDTLRYVGPNTVNLFGGDGADYLAGSAGADVLDGGDGTDVLEGQDGHNILRGGAGGDSLTGGTGNDVLQGGTGADYMWGGNGDDIYIVDDAGDQVSESDFFSGNDTIESSVNVFGADTGIENITLTGTTADWVNGNGRDNVITGNSLNNYLFDGWAGDDTLRGNDGDDYLSASIGNDTLEGGVGWDRLYGGEGDDVLDGGADFDNMEGGRGNDTYVVDHVSDQVQELWNEGTDTVVSSIDYSLWNVNLEHLTLTGNTAQSAYGNDGDNTITGNDISNWLLGWNGNDTLGGMGGDDQLLGWDGNDLLQGGSGFDYLSGDAGDDQLFGGDQQDQLYGGVGSDVLDGGTGADWMVGGLGDDIYVVDNTSDQIQELWDEGTDTVLSSVDYWMAGNDVDNLTLTGTQAFVGGGNFKDNIIIGNDANNYLHGADGSDHLDGGGGTDILYGNTGDDTYIVDDQGDSVWEYVAEGTDSVQSSINYVLGSDLENLTLTGSMALTGTGNELDNEITGNSLDNMLDGSAGADTLAGNIGNDQLIGGTGNDTYRFNLGDGIDTIQDFSFPAEGNRILFGQGITRQDLTLTHNPLEQTLTIQVGNGGDAIRLTNFDPNYSRVIATLQFNDGSQVAMAELLGPTQGDDILNGTPGDDVIDGLGGNDVINGLAGNDTLLGGEGHDTLNGGDGDDILDGGIYSDTMAGGAGNDIYIVDLFDETVTEAVDEGVDTVQSAISGYTLSAHVENLTLTGTAMTGIGNELDNVLVGNDGFNLLNGWAGNDQLNGRSGADIMAGMAGDDIYVVDDAGDVLIESAGEGNDTAYSSVSYDLSMQGNEVETLALTGTSSIDAKGNGSDNTLSGNSGDNLLDGNFGNDTLQGEGGNDTYIVSEFGDVVIEQANDGIDTVQSSVAFYTLGAHVENLSLTNFAFDGTGNELNNVLTGNDMNNRLDGGANSDMMIGGLGDDTFLVDNVADVITESLSEGNDTVQSSVSFTLGANVENLTLTGGAAVNATGNSLANILVGNSEANIVDGDTGSDSMSGGQGDDTYLVEHAGDTVTELANEGTDTVQSSRTYTLGANVENLTLIGSSAINGTGNGLDNIFTGNSAANVLTGGAGNDTYIIGAGDSIVEAAGSGTDTVQSALTHTLGSNLENLTLTGSSAINGTGNSLANVLTGNSAANVLKGGAGNDTYVVGAGDSVVDSGGGADTVQSSVTWTLGSNLEHLTLTGSAAINGTGNGSANILTGNSANNVLSGASGTDTLRGGMGNDTANGGSGNDTFQFGRGEGQDLVQDNSGSADKLLYDTGINPLDLVISRQANDLRLAIHGSADYVTVQNWYTSSSNRTETIQAGDGQILLSTQVDQLIQAMAGFTQQTGLSWDQGIDQQPAEVQSILAASWQ